MFRLLVTDNLVLTAWRPNNKQRIRFYNNHFAVGPLREANNQALWSYI